MIIGLVGKNAAGKGEVAKFLETIGYTYFSLSDVLRDELNKVGEQITRRSLTDFANKLRSSKGPGVLAELVSKKIEHDGNYAIDSIRHPAEVHALQNLSNFYLLAIEADSKIRFDRMKSRHRESDPETYEEFLEQEILEAAGKRETDQQLNKTIDMCDARIENSETLEVLHEKVREVVRVLAMDVRRPSWDEYFMSIARQVSLRSNCMKRKVAAVIVKENRIISTGYNGTPRGIRNCNEGGCPRCSSFGASGSNLDQCVCSHAEENAIVQAAYHGVPINGATLYSTFSPCLLCTKMIINAGVGEVIYNKSYALETTALKLLEEAKIKVRQYEYNAE